MLDLDSVLFASSAPAVEQEEVAQDTGLGGLGGLEGGLGDQDSHDDILDSLADFGGELEGLWCIFGLRWFLNGGLIVFLFCFQGKRRRRR